MPAPRKSVMPAPTLALIVLAVMIGLYGIDKFLAAQEQSELEQEAHRDYVQGQKLLHAGKAHQAVVNFAHAHTLERGDREYQLAWATAQLADREFSSAKDTLNELLDDDSNDGRANLLMARVLAAEGRYKEADSYYHRAIYGEWPSNPSAEPSSGEHVTDEQWKVRLELANVLAKHGNNQELLSELLLLDNVPARDPATERQIAALFLQAGSGQRAADVYQRLIREDPNDVDAHIGLGRAQILAGNYRAAENAIMAALHHDPYNERVQSQLRLVAKLASLDPTARRLSTAEKYRRSQQILELTRADLNACTRSTEAVKPEKPPATVTNEDAEALLDRAENLWKQRVEACQQPLLADDPLPLLMKKLSL
jgi:tetratricopeptide (TPR) repeat protein